MKCPDPDHPLLVNGSEVKGVRDELVAEGGEEHGGQLQCHVPDAIPDLGSLCTQFQYTSSIVLCVRVCVWCVQCVMCMCACVQCACVCACMC